MTTALLAVSLIGVSALAVDVGTWEMNKSGMQGAADQAVLGASLVISPGLLGEEVARKEVRGVAAAHGFVNGQGGVTVTTNIPPQTGRYAGTSGAIEVVITQQQKSILSGVIQDFSAPIASAKAVVTPGTAKACLLTLGLTGTGIRAVNGANVTSEACNIYVNSTGSCHVELINFSIMKGFDIFLRKTNPCLVNSSKISAVNKLHTNANAVEDPYRTRIMPSPEASCINFERSNSANYTIKPGTYCYINGLNLTHIKLEPGLYVVKNGGIKLSNSSSITGTGVTLVITGDSGSSYNGITIDNGSSLTLTSMTTGPTKGIAFWLDKKQPAKVELVNGPKLNITGAFYAPGADVKWANSATTNSKCLQVVVKSIEFINSSNFQHDCDDLNVEKMPSTSGYTLRE